MAFSDIKSAAKMRDLIVSIARQELERLRPPYRYGTVVSVDAAARTAAVLLEGHDAPVQVSIGSHHPVMAGLIVRIGGLRGDAYVDDVMSSTFKPYLQVDSGNLPDEPDDGLLLLETDTGVIRRSEGGDWVAPFTLGSDQGGYDTPTGTTASTSYINYGSLGGISVDKVYDETKLLVSIHFAGGNSNALATSKGGVQISSTDYDIATANGGDATLSGSRIFTGIAAGTVAITPRIKVNAGTWTATTAGVRSISAVELF